MGQEILYFIDHSPLSCIIGVVNVRQSFVQRFCDTSSRTRLDPHLSHPREVAVDHVVTVVD
jgi:hypothetical protein